MAQPQNFENHAKFVPAFHLVTLGIFFINLVWSIIQVIRSFSFQTVMSLLVAVAFLLAALYARMFALTVQDRVIRLEMQLRLQKILPPDLRSRISEFEVGQLIALRFASDRELPDLARKVLDEKLSDRETIKKLVKDWQPDLLRA
jgi:dolichyl-phosphate-mannose--protein O-mannosyl transferase